MADRHGGYNFAGFIDVARVLLRHSGDEAFTRSAVSRAYYGAFHAVRQRIVDLAPAIASADFKHRQMWDQLSIQPDQVWREVGELGQELLRQRVKADYRPLAVFTTAHAEDEVLRAETIIRQVVAITTPPPRPLQFFR